MQTENDETAAAIQKAVIHAFSEVKRPKDHELAPHECWECAEIRQHLSPHSFDSVTDTDLDRLHDFLPLLGPKGLHYYLPAFILRSLRECNWIGIENLIFYLSPTQTSLQEREDYWRDRLGVFSSQQRAVILSFLDWLESSAVGPNYGTEIAAARKIWRLHA